MLTTQSEITAEPARVQSPREPMSTVLVLYRQGAPAVDQRLDRACRALVRAGNVWVVALPYGPSESSRSDALRLGMEQADSEYVAWLDLDRGVAADRLPTLVRLLELYEADAVVGSRSHPGSRLEMTWRRRVVAGGYRRFARAVLRGSVDDMRAGVGVVRRDVLRAVLPHCRGDEPLLEVELLVMAEHLGHRRLLEAPVRIEPAPGHPAGVVTAMATARGTLALRKRLARLRRTRRTGPQPAVAGLRIAPLDTGKVRG